MKYVTIINNKQFEVEILRDGAVMVNGKRHEVDFREMGESLFSIIKDTRSLELAIDGNQDHYEVLLGGRLYEAQVLDQRSMLMLNRRGGLKMDSGDVYAPMPGLIVEVMVNVGDTVTEGQTVVILESMKMQNELKAPRTGIVQTIHVQSGQTVDKSAMLISVTIE